MNNKKGMIFMTKTLIKLDLLEVLGELTDDQIDRYKSNPDDYMVIISILEEVGKIDHEQAQAYRKEVI